PCNSVTSRTSSAPARERRRITGAEPAPNAKKKRPDRDRGPASFVAIERALNRVALRPERQRTNSLTRGRVDRVRDRGRGRRERRLAASGRRKLGLEEVHLDLGRLVDPDQRILVEVGLLDAPVLERDRKPHRS